SSVSSGSLLVLVHSAARHEVHARLQVRERYHDSVSLVMVWRRRRRRNKFPNYKSCILADLLTRRGGKSGHAFVRTYRPERFRFLEFDEHRSQRILAGAFFAVRDAAP